jgi:hypothetical protein
LEAKSPILHIYIFDKLLESLIFNYRCNLPVELVEVSIIATVAAILAYALELFDVETVVFFVITVDAKFKKIK